MRTWRRTEGQSSIKQVINNAIDNIGACLIFPLKVTILPRKGVVIRTHGEVWRWSWWGGCWRWTGGEGSPGSTVPLAAALGLCSRQATPHHPPPSCLPPADDDILTTVAATNALKWAEEHKCSCRQTRKKQLVVWSHYRSPCHSDWLTCLRSCWCWWSPSWTGLPPWRLLAFDFDWHFLIATL